MIITIKMPPVYDDLMIAIINKAMVHHMHPPPATSA